MERTPARGSRSRWAAVAALGAALVVLAGCSGGAGGSSGNATGDAGTVNRLQVMAPADPGGGWDQTARALGAAAEDAGLARNVQVSNVGGAGGTVGLAQLANERSEDYLMVMGLVMVGAIETNQSQATLQNTTPIARLTAEDEIVVVPAASPYRTINDLVADMAARGQAVSIAGGSAGGTDHILAGLIAKAGGVPVSNLNYVAFSGGGESLAALLGSQVAAGISGVGEYAEQVQAGALRALAVSGAQRVEGIDAPTLTEAGLNVEMSNWRGVVAPPNLSAETKARLTTLVGQLYASPAWKEQMTRNGWTDTYLSGPAFESFLTDEQARVRGVLTDLGLVQ